MSMAPAAFICTDIDRTTMLQKKKKKRAMRKGGEIVTFEMDFSTAIYWYC